MFSKIVTGMKKDVTLLPLRLLALLPVLVGPETGVGILWKYTLLGSSAVSDWVERFL